MEKTVIAILQDLHPEIDFNAESHSLVSEGILDSFDIVQIIAELDSSYGIKIPGTELVPENFDSVISICMLVKKYHGGDQ